MRPGTRVEYVGTTVPQHTGLKGRVTSITRDGWLRVRFDGHAASVKCADHNLKVLAK